MSIIIDGFFLDYIFEMWDKDKLLLSGYGGSDVVTVQEIIGGVHSRKLFILLKLIAICPLWMFVVSGCNGVYKKNYAIICLIKIRYGSRAGIDI